MTAHPNRSIHIDRENPTPELIRSTRLAAGLTQVQAGAVIGYTERSWQRLEAEPGAESRRLHPVMWRAWLHLAGLKQIPFAARRSPDRR